MRARTAGDRESGTMPGRPASAENAGDCSLRTRSTAASTRAQDNLSGRLHQRGVKRSDVPSRTAPARRYDHCTARGGAPPRMPMAASSTAAAPIAPLSAQ
jgi:hypothetical protein